MPSESDPTTPQGAPVHHLLVALLLLIWLIGFLNACGSEDLVFPGQPGPTVPATATGQPTATEIP